jgi:hypothetical protein
MRQEAHHQMHQGKNAAGHRGDGQQLNHARQRQTNRQRHQQLDIASANPSPLVDDQQQQKQDRSSDQRLGNLHRAGHLTDDPEKRERQTNLISDQPRRDIDRCDIEQQQDFQNRGYGNNPTHQIHASEKGAAEANAPLSQTVPLTSDGSRDSGDDRTHRIRQRRVDGISSTERGPYYRDDTSRDDHVLELHHAVPRRFNPPAVLMEDLHTPEIPLTQTQHFKTKSWEQTNSQLHCRKECRGHSRVPPDQKLLRKL